MLIAIDKIQPSPDPIRKLMDEAKLEELAQSIREQGLIVPIKVRPNGVGYEIVYGHRRFAAAQMAGLEKIEAIVESLDDETTLLQAGMENLSNEDMSAYDKGRWVVMIITTTGWSVYELGKRSGIADRLLGQWKMYYEERKAGTAVTSVQRGGEGIQQTEEIRRVLEKPEEKRAVADYVEREGLTYQQTRQVAEAYKAAKDPRRKQQLLERPYDPTFHDKEWVEWREKQYGQADPELAPKHERKDEEWRNLPEVKRALEFPQQVIDLITLTRQMAHEGKFAPEAVSFIGRRWLKVQDHVDKLIDEFGVD